MCLDKWCQRFSWHFMCCYISQSDILFLLSVVCNIHKQTLAWEELNYMNCLSMCRCLQFIFSPAVLIGTWRQYDFILEYGCRQHSTHSQWFLWLWRSLTMTQRRARTRRYSTPLRFSAHTKGIFRLHYKKPVWRALLLWRMNLSSVAGSTWIEQKF